MMLPVGGSTGVGGQGTENPESNGRRLELSRALNRLSQAILRGDTTQDILQSLVEIAGPALQVDRALIYDIQFSTQLAVGLCEWIRPGRDITATKATYPLSLFGSAADELARSGAQLHSSRDEIHPLLAHDGAARLLHDDMSIHRLLWHPFRRHDDGFYLLAFNQCADERAWSDDELQFIEFVAAQSNLAIMKLDLLRENERAQAELRESKARLQWLYDDTPSMFFAVDQGGLVQRMNRFAMDCLGYSQEELVGQSVLRVVHPDDRERVTTHLATCFADPGRIHELSFRKIRTDESIVWVRETIRVVDGPDGPSALIVCEDVTQVRANEEAARRAEDRAHDRDEFMAMLGHELRNPLSPLVTALEILRSRGHAAPELDVIDRQVAHLRRLVDDLLDMSRITRGAVELRKERVELAGVAAQAAEVVRPLFEKKRHELDLAIPSQGLTVDADPARLVQVFSNLLANAAKYSEPGRNVVLSAERRGPRVVIEVRDQGYGIEPEMLERVFDLFVQRTQPSDRVEGGLGLGLPIVRNLVRQHAGTVRATSPGLGKGTTITVELPAADDERVVAGAVESLRDIERSARTSAAHCVLVVDDNADARQTLCEALTLCGYTAHGAADGPEALALAATLAPTIAVVDIGLPAMDGYELARRLRATGPERLRLLALSGYGQERDRARSQQAGFEAHLIKPIDIGQLLKLIEDE